MADGVRFPDDMSAKTNPLHLDDKMLISDSQDAKKAKWWTLSVIRDWISTLFASRNAGNIDGTNLTAWQDALKIALFSDKIGNATELNVYTIDINGVFATAANSSNLPGTNKVGLIKAIISGSTKYLLYQTSNSGKTELWANYFNGTTWTGWNQIGGNKSLTREIMFYVFQEVIVQHPNSESIISANLSSNIIDIEYSVDGGSFWGDPTYPINVTAGGETLWRVKTYNVGSNAGNVIINSIVT